MNKAWPAPAGHHSTRQWLKRSDCVLPPSGLRRTNEFSPVIKTSLGSTGGAMSYSSLGRVGALNSGRRATTARAPAGAMPMMASGRVGCHLHAGVVVTGALGDVGVVGRTQRGHGLAVVARGEPRALEAAHHPRRDGIGQAEGQPHLAQVVPDPHAGAVAELAGPRVDGIHLE